MSANLNTYDIGKGESPDSRAWPGLTVVLKDGSKGIVKDAILSGKGYQLEVKLNNGKIVMVDTKGNLIKEELSRAGKVLLKLREQSVADNGPLPDGPLKKKKEKDKKSKVDKITSF